MCKMIYSKTTHNIRRSIVYRNTYSLTIYFLELTINYETNELIDVCGFIPLIKADKCTIKIPKSKSGKYYLKIKTPNSILENQVYNYCDKIDTSGACYLEKPPVKFDSDKGIICIGESDCNLNKESTIRINGNLICTVDEHNELRCIYIIPDVFE